MSQSTQPDQPTKVTRAAARRVAIIGARGHVGAELLRLLDQHPHFEVVLVSSRNGGVPIHSEVPGLTKIDLAFEAVTPDDLPTLAERHIDLWVLALPNGHSEPWVTAIEAHAPASIIVDLSTDHRFDTRWQYGLPEVHRPKLLGAKRISNPGCYATGAQLALYPLLDLLDGPAHIFGVSGYSGAGTTPSPRNDPAQLADNLMPYSLTGHAHETEIRWQLGHKVFFMPHVAPFFRGIVLTVSAQLKRLATLDELAQRYTKAYQYEPLVTVQKDIPFPRDAAHRHGVTIGGLSLEPTMSHVVVCATLDNLLKGAATQCLQNMNLAAMVDEFAGLRHFL
jgi:N-acetyl-gamma-glutamyl-phosphate reductase common form